MLNGQSGLRLVAFPGLLMTYFRQSRRRAAMFLENMFGLRRGNGTGEVGMCCELHGHQARLWTLLDHQSVETLLMVIESGYP